MSKRRRRTTEDDDLDQVVNSAKSINDLDRDARNDSLIKQANALDDAAFQTRYLNPADLSFTNNDRAYDIDFSSVANLAKQDLHDCFSLIHTTSGEDYAASSWGWHPKRKLREMQEPEMRYLIVRLRPSTPVTATATPPSPGLAISTFAGFLSFMLTHDSTPSVPVLYVYEIHLTAATQGHGLGGRLMGIVEAVARRVGVAKVMLTCFRRNARARAFYGARGYAPDACSPGERRTRRKVVEVDYVIMSKEVRGEDGEAVTATYRREL